MTFNLQDRKNSKTKKREASSSWSGDALAKSTVFSTIDFQREADPAPAFNDQATGVLVGTREQFKCEIECEKASAFVQR